MDEGTSRVEASLSEEVPWRGPRGGGSFAADPGRYVKKSPGYGHPFPCQMLLLHPQSNPVFIVYAVCL